MFCFVKFQRSCTQERLSNIVGYWPSMLTIFKLGSIDMQQPLCINKLFLRFNGCCKLHFGDRTVNNQTTIFLSCIWKKASWTILSDVCSKYQHWFRSSCTAMLVLHQTHQTSDLNSQHFFGSCMEVFNCCLWIQWNCYIFDRKWK